MDAKPQRPARALRIRNDENSLPAAPMAKTIHQRNKSSPALSSLHNAAGSKAGAKRTAFADVSNVINLKRPSKDDSVIAAKQSLGLATKQPGALQERKSAAFLRPAQRPLSVSSLRSLLTGSNAASSEGPIVPVVEDQSLVPITNTRRLLTKRNTTIFKDIALDTVHEVAHVSNSQEALNKAVPEKPESLITNALRPLPESQITLPPPLEQLPSIGDPLKENHHFNSENVLPAISEVSLDVPILSTHTDEELNTKADQLADHDTNGNNNKIDLLPGPISTTTEMSQSILLEPAETSLPPLRTFETYIPAALRPIVPVEPVLASVAQYVQPTAPNHTEPEGNWDEDEDEPYEEEGYVTARSYHSKGDNTTGAATVVIFPQVNQKVRREISAARSLVEATRTAEEIEDESYDTSMVAEYGDEIFEYMQQLEVKMLPNAHYMETQHEIQWSMRSVLMDWLVQVHHRFNLLPETLFLCVNYIDRFLSCKVVSLGKLQLVGATAIFIAAKYEEINCPSVQEIVYMVDGGYTVDEVLKAERFMLTMLQFELGWPGPMSFLRRISKADDYDLETRTLAKYFLEVTVMDERFIGSPPSFTAAASHCLARMMLRKGTWTPHHVFYSNYTLAQLKPLLILLLECCEDPRKHHAAVYNKYCDKRFKRASTFVEGEMQRGFRLPSEPPQQFLPFYNNNAYLDV